MAFQCREQIISKLLDSVNDVLTSTSSSGDSAISTADRQKVRQKRWTDTESFIQDNLLEVYDKLPLLEKQIWGKVIAMEGDRRTAKAYLRHPNVTLDGSDAEFDGLRLGLGRFENSTRSPLTAQILCDIQQGIKVKIDPEGNIWAKRMCYAPVFLKPLYRSRPGDLFFIDQRPVKVFDIQRFKEILVQELKNSGPDRAKLEKCCMVCLKFSVDDDRLLSSPCWVAIVHLIAIELLNLVLPRDADCSSPSSSFALALSRNSSPMIDSPSSTDAHPAPPQRSIAKAERLLGLIPPRIDHQQQRRVQQVVPTTVRFETGRDSFNLITNRHPEVHQQQQQPHQNHHPTPPPPQSSSPHGGVLKRIARREDDVITRHMTSRQQQQDEVIGNRQRQFGMDSSVEYCYDVCAHPPPAPGSSVSSKGSRPSPLSSLNRDSTAHNQHHHRQNHRGGGGSMVDLRQINRFISPVYFDRLDSTRVSGRNRGGTGHPRGELPTPSGAKLSARVRSVEALVHLPPKTPKSIFSSTHAIAAENKATRPHRFYRKDSWREQLQQQRRQSYDDEEHRESLMTRMDKWKSHDSGIASANDFVHLAFCRSTKAKSSPMDEDNFICDVCRAKMKSELSLKRHLDASKPDASKAQVQQANCDGSVSVPRLLVCGWCGVCVHAFKCNCADGSVTGCPCKHKQAIQIRSVAVVTKASGLMCLMCGHKAHRDCVKEMPGEHYRSDTTNDKEYICHKCNAH